MRTITAKELHDLRTEHEDLVLVNVLSEDSFETEHIPGSTNIPETRDDFVTAVRDLAGSKDRPVVVYCASKDCTASPSAAKKLHDAGFTDVMDFEGGLAEWKLAGNTVESGEPAEAPA